MEARLDPAILKQYDVADQVGQGAYGVVWRGVDKKTGRTVAIKKVIEAFGCQQDAQRTYREVKYLEALTGHPNIVELIRIHPAQNKSDLYIVFEFVERDLARELRKGPLEEIMIQRTMYQLLLALSYIHSAGVIHRDIKPGNVLLNETLDKAKLCDFGFSRSQIIDPNSYENDCTNTSFDAVQPLQRVATIEGVEEETVREDNTQLNNDAANLGGASEDSMEVSEDHRDADEQDGRFEGDSPMQRMGTSKTTVEEDDDGGMTDYVASRYYRSPELLLGSKSYTQAVDLWAAGCLMAEMFRGKPIFQGSSTIEQLRAIVLVLGNPSSQDIESFRSYYARTMLESIGVFAETLTRRVSAPVIQSQRPLSSVDLIRRLHAQRRESSAPPMAQPRDSLKSLIYGASAEAVDLISRLLTYNIHHRITASDALAHPFFQNVRAMESEILFPLPHVTLPIPDHKRESCQEYIDQLFQETPGRFSALTSFVNSFSRAHNNTPQSKHKQTANHSRVKGDGGSNSSQGASRSTKFLKPTAVSSATTIVSSPKAMAPPSPAQANANRRGKATPPKYDTKLRRIQSLDLPKKTGI
eukprot:c18999_g2_i1.p1 GENE.c18999_g2_i1~~c18999_g2_i1.p1  ORF type:complete len:601 (+),score=117.53 c18999_g2_i1:57-1805(+)